MRIPVVIEDTDIAVLSGHPLADGSPEEGSAPKSMSWSSISSLAEGSLFFVFGTLSIQKNGRLCFKNTPDNPMTVVLFEEEPQNFLYWSVWSARQRNEFWNKMTPASLLVGALLYLLLSLSLSGLQIQRFWLAVSLSGSLVPILPLFPPGLIFYFLYRRYWNQGRLLRAERDVIALPVVTFYPDFQTGSRGLRGMLESAGDDDFFRQLTGQGRMYRVRRITQEELPGLVEQGYQVRQSSIVVPESGGEDYWGLVFEPRDEDLRGHRHSDPMVERVCIPGKPLALLQGCQVAAERKETLGILYFLIGLALNEALVVWILWQTLKVLG